MYRGDFQLGDTLDFKFTTVGTTGAPTTLAGTPVVSAYPSNSTTEVTAGITLTVDFDSRTGMHNVRVVATAANGYLTATNYELVITTGTVGGTSVVGYVVGAFSIENRTPKQIRYGTAQAGASGTITLDASASAVDSFYNYDLIQIYGGTGVGQSRMISAYVGSTKVASVGQNWATNPDSTSQFVIIPSGVISATAALTAAETRTALGLNSANLDTQLDAIPTAAENSDYLLARDLGSGTGAGTLNERTVRAALRWNRNKITIVGTTMTVYKEDDTTIAWTGTVSGGLAVALGMDAT